MRGPRATPVRVDEPSPDLIQDAMAWCAQHGLVYGAQNPSDPCALVHAPFALTPVPFPRQAFERAVAASRPFNAMIDRVSRDEAYLKSVLDAAAKGDAEFTGRLMEIYTDEMQWRRERGASASSSEMSLVLTRSDYMLHDPTSTMLQVELNTIASSFGCLSTLVGGLHRFILGKAGVEKEVVDGALPVNTSMTALVDGLAAGVEAHGHEDRTMVMVVQPDEQNSFDQQWLQFQLWDRYGVRTIRKTLREIRDESVVSETGDGDLRLDGKVVSLVYFRAGYTPNDYLGEEEWEARRVIERSSACKCPTVAMQLAGSKKVQQDLAKPGVVERFSDSTEDASLMRTCFAGLWGLDELSSDAEAQQAVRAAIEDPGGFVLKPQREGGGNNMYGAELKAMLESGKDVSDLVLMQKILPPSHRTTMVRRGAYEEMDTLSELGIYGVLLRVGEDVVMNNEAGVLVRTKPAVSAEGGVAAGFAVLDSVQLC